VEIRLDFKPEAETTDAERAAVGQLLYEVFGDERALGRGWTLHPPAYRGLAWEGNELVGCANGSFPECEPQIRLYGTGDAAVRPGARGLGIIRQMHDYTHEQLVPELGIDAILTATLNLAWLMEKEGYERPGPGQVFLVENGARRELGHPWYIRWFAPRVEPLAITRRF
jgi:GNAT superfamily N-acetyltransferase